MVALECTAHVLNQIQIDLTAPRVDSATDLATGVNGGCGEKGVVGGQPPFIVADRSRRRGYV